MRKYLFPSMICSLVACAGSPKLDESAARAMYVRAVDLRMEGDLRASQDLLLEVAHRAPDTRAGVKARAVLSSGDLLFTGPAVVGVLAAIAVPNFVRYQLRSKTSEARTNLGGIVASQESVRASSGRYLPADPTGTAPPGAEKQPWQAKPCSESCTPRDGRNCASFECIGFRPDGDVYYSYACTVTQDGSHFTCAAMGDLDGDGDYSLFVYGTGEGSLAAPIPQFGERTPECDDPPVREIYDCTPGTY